MTVTKVSPFHRLRHTVQETASLLAISERQCWRLISGKKLPVTKEGRRTFVSRADLDRYVATGGGAI